MRYLFVVGAAVFVTAFVTACRWRFLHPASLQSLAYAKLHAFESGHGWFFWNFKTELEVRLVFLLLYYNCIEIFTQH